jgi:hypothetical protein
LNHQNRAKRLQILITQKDGYDPFPCLECTKVKAIKLFKQPKGKRKATEVKFPDFEEILSKIQVMDEESEKFYYIYSL